MPYWWKWTSADPGDVIAQLEGVDRLARTLLEPSARDETVLELSGIRENIRQAFQDDVASAISKIRSFVGPTASNDFDE